MHLADVRGRKADAGEPLAPRREDLANAIGAPTGAARRHQFERHVVEREQHAIGTVAGLSPGGLSRQQRLVGGHARVHVVQQDDDMVEPRDHGNSPLVFLAARTFSTPIAIAAVRCETFSLLTRFSMVSKARSRIWYSRRITSSSSQNNCCRSCT